MKMSVVPCSSGIIRSSSLRSVPWSSAEVASSKIRMAGLWSYARAGGARQHLFPREKFHSSGYCQKWAHAV
nr:hypothetical protein [Paenibacillus sp. 1_12]